MSDKPDILLVNLPPWGVDVPPLGTACLSSYLRDKGISTEIFDLNTKLYNGVPQKCRYLWSMNYAHWWRQKEELLKFDEKIKTHLNSLIDEIVNSSSPVLGLSSLTDSSNLILEEIVKRVKRVSPFKIIVLGGVNVTVKEQREVLLNKIKDYVDYCVLGEGETALYKLLLSILNKENTKAIDIKGVLVKETFFDDLTPEFGERLDNFPYPTFDEFNLNEYKSSNCVVMEFSRGCIGNCPFCSVKSIFPFFKSKSALNIFNQIKFYKEKYNIEYISVSDAAANGNIKVLEETCNLLIKNRLFVNITGLAISRREMTEDLLRKMKRAGFFRLEYGIESGSNKILKAMRKMFTRKIAEKVLRDTHKVGIKTCLYFIVGYPGETEQDFNETKEFLKRNTKFITLIKSINPLYIMTGSEIFHNPKKYGITFPQDSGEFNWHIPRENNTREVRERKIKELKNLASQSHIPYTEEAECIEFTNKVLEEKKDKHINEDGGVICP